MIHSLPGWSARLDSYHPDQRMILQSQVVLQKHDGFCRAHLVICEKISPTISNVPSMRVPECKSQQFHKLLHALKFDFSLVTAH